MLCLGIVLITVGGFILRAQGEFVDRFHGKTLLHKRDNKCLLLVDL